MAIHVPSSMSKQNQWLGSKCTVLNLISSCKMHDQIAIWYLVGALTNVAGATLHAALKGWLWPDAAAGVFDLNFLPRGHGELGENLFVKNSSQ
jgi:hypothetical protein